MSQPSLVEAGPHVSTAFFTSVALSVRDCSSLNAYRLYTQPASLYEATANCAFGWAARTSFMMLMTLVLTFAIGSVMLPVVSARNTMSGFGGTRGVIWLRSCVLVPPVDGSAPPIA